ncbi:MAG TPA: polysaccharide deacetylase family protein [Alphaproteobacteria bacterium]|nr:polysaccharide deacetylase family protein [Alphaproteobacteria bacterium]
MTATTTKTDPWAALDAELDRWAAASRIADLWWRDDDAVAPGPKLARLFDVTAATGLLLAVIPARLEDALGPVVAAASHVRIAQHGYAHVNHAPKGQGLGAWELGLHRGEAAVLADLDRGRARLETMFGERFLPVVVPPWNRIDPALFGPLVARGYRGVSAFGPRANGIPGLVLANAQCDPIAWKNGPRFTGESKALGEIIGHLEARRTGTADAGEPTGFLTHHIDLDEAGWAFCARLANAVQRHPAAHWRGAYDIFGGDTMSPKI